MLIDKKILWVAGILLVVVGAYFVLTKMKAKEDENSEVGELDRSEDIVTEEDKIRYMSQNFKLKKVV